MAEVFSKQFGIKFVGLRFFTVYGEWGRPDMFMMKYLTSSYNPSKKFYLNNYGNHTRDFSYIDDVVMSLKKLKNKYPKKIKNINSYNPSLSSASFQILNIGNQSKVKLMDYINEIEKNLKIKAKKNFLKLQLGDIPKSYSKMSNTSKLIKYKFQVNYKEGVRKFVEWFIEHYKKN